MCSKWVVLAVRACIVVLSVNGKFVSRVWMRAASFSAFAADSCFREQHLQSSECRMENHSVVLKGNSYCSGCMRLLPAARIQIQESCSELHHRDECDSCEYCLEAINTLAFGVINCRFLLGS